MLLDDGTQEISENGQCLPVLLSRLVLQGKPRPRPCLKMVPFSIGEGNHQRNFSSHIKTIIR